MKTDGTENLCLWCMEAIGNARVCPHCGHDRREDVSDVQCLQPGALLNHERYLIGRVLGAGGFGITYLAFDCVLQVKRAVKEFFPQSLVVRSDASMVKTSSTSNAPSFQKGLDSFHKEALSLARFGTHPNVVKIHDFFEENGTAYFVMDYIEGQSFDSYLKTHGNQLSWEETLRILRPIGDALIALHAVDLLHRDVKPANIFITREGKSILLDFGSARYTTSGETNSLTAILTPGYAPMEQYGTKHQGTWTDVYAYAATFYRAMSGVTPPISTERIAEDELRPLRELIPGIPESVSNAVSRGLALKVSARTQTVSEFLSGFPPLPPSSDDGKNTEPVNPGKNPGKADRKAEERRCPLCFTLLDTGFCPECGFGITGKSYYREDHWLRLGTRLKQGRYETGRVLGSGGFGITYLAYDHKTQARRAIKEFYPQNLVYRSGSAAVTVSSGSEKASSYKKGLESFHKEAMALQKFGSNPNVVKVYDYFEENGTAYFVMDYVEGESFQSYLESHGNKLPWKEAVRILKPIGEALSALHAQNLLHRDVKPANIFITREGKPLLLDFGSARYVISGETKALTTILTPGYAPLEQYGTANQGSWTDVYALAATFYRAVSGIKPQASTNRSEEDNLKPLHVLDASIPESVSNAVSRAIAIKKADRTQTVAEFLSGLQIKNEYPQREPGLLRIGTMVDGKYRIEQIRATGESTVYLALNTELNINVYLFECSLLGKENSSRSQDEIERENENRRSNYYKTAKYFENCKHRNLMRVNSVFRENRTVYAEVPYHEGCTLQQYLDAHQGKIPWEEARKIWMQVGAAVEELHRRNLLYCNISPKNIFLCSDGTPILWTFTSTITMSEAEDATSIVLTHCFAPPEQYRIEHLGPWIDVYGLAATFYRVVSGNMPLPATDRMSKDGLQPLNEVNRLVPSYIGAAVSRAMSPDFRKRTQTVAEFLSGLSASNTPPLEEKFCPQCFTYFTLKDADSVCPKCGLDNSWENRHDAIPVGSIIGGHYLVGMVLGVNSFTITYLAYDLEQKEKRVIREFFPGGLAIRSGLDVSISGENFYEKSKFYREVMDYYYQCGKTYSELSEQPNMARMYAPFLENGTAYCVSEYVEGEYFDAYLKSHGNKLSWKDTLQFLEPVGNALSTLHKNRLFYLNVNPKNIVITQKNTPKLLPYIPLYMFSGELDLLIGYSEDLTTQSILSRRYVALEVISKKAGAHSDVYSLAATFYRAVSGVVPEHSQYRFHEDSLVPLKKLDRRIPQSVSDAVSRAMAVGIKDRTQTVTEFLASLPPKNENPWRKFGILVVVILGILALLGIGAYCLNGKPTNTPVPIATATVKVQSVITDAIRNAQVGDHVKYGHYEQDNDLSNGAEAIEWRVLAREDNRVLLISEYGLDAKAYNEKWVDITWEKSTLRSWLNGEFYKSAFSAEEKKQIAETEVKAEKNPSYSTNPGNDTQDRIFLLSISGANTYFKNDTDRQCKVTAYAEAQGALPWNEYGGTGWWWLRSPGDDSVCATFVYADGSVGSRGDLVDGGGGVARPALWLNL